MRKRKVVTVDVACGLRADRATSLWGWTAETRVRIWIAVVYGAGPRGPGAARWGMFTTPRWAPVYAKTKSC
jgi:hypothetical protein